MQFSQFLLFQGNSIAEAGYFYCAQPGDSYIGYFGSIDIASSANGARGILVTSLAVPGVDVDNLSRWSALSPQRNGQLYGSSGCYYYLLDDLINGNNMPLRITASNCLVDPDIPLRYSLQNAFDGNPATSFVENAGSEEIRIGFIYPNDPQVGKLAVVNGFASDLETYNNYSRIKRFISHIAEQELADGELSYQFVAENVGFNFWVRETFEGEKYNNLAVAEFNFLTDNGWLFGDINE